MLSFKLMFQDARFWTAVVTFGIAAWLIVPQVIGDRAPVVRAEDLPEGDYICRESREVFRLPATAITPFNPKTGKPTLVPAVYDANKKSWKQGPPLDVRQRMRRRPTH